MGRHHYDRRRHVNEYRNDNDHNVREEQHVQRSHVPVNEPEPEETTFQYGREDLPNPQRPRFAKVREEAKHVSNSGIVRRIQEWNEKRNAPVTQEEVQQMKLRAEKERFKTQTKVYQSQRRGLLFAGALPLKGKSVGRGRVAYEERRQYRNDFSFGFGSGSILGSRRTSNGSRPFGNGLASMLGSGGKHGKKQRSRSKYGGGYGTNLNNMFGF